MAENDDIRRYDKLLETLKGFDSLLVAYSGGLDSTLLAYAAHQSLGDRSLAVTAVSPSLAQADRQRAARIARQVGFRHQEIETEELQKPDYRKNDPDRCFHCKTELFNRMKALAAELNFSTLAYGAIPEDQSDHRPGARAAQLANVTAPLAEAGLTKPALRRLSQTFGLETWDLPAQACLASRIAYQTPVSAAKLRMVEEGEALLKSLGFESCRVRHHDGLARIEVPLPRLQELLDQRELISDQFRRLGFVYVTLDLMGLRSGSMNEILKLRVLD